VVSAPRDPLAVAVRDSDPDIAEGIASLLGLIKKSAMAAMASFHRLHGAVADAAPAPAGERWDYDKGTSPGGKQPLSEQDAAIVRRLRTLSPDGRFDGYSNDALIHLFGGISRRWAGPRSRSWT
jgi:hypothetical protein